MPSRLGSPTKEQGKDREALARLERSQGERRVEGPWQGYVPQHQGGIVPSSAFREVMGLVPLSGELWPDWGWFKFEDSGSGVETSAIASANYEGAAGRYFQQAAASVQGFSNNFSVAVWVSDHGQTGAQTQYFIFSVATSGGADNINRVSIDVAQFGVVRFRLWDSAGTPFKDYEATLLGLESFTHLVMTYNGTNLLLYQNGVLVDASFITLTTDIAGAGMTDTSRKVTLGASPTATLEWYGRYYSAAVWNTALPATEVAALWAVGDGRVALDTNFGAYLSGGTLLNWWKLGFADPVPDGTDYKGTNDLATTGGAWGAGQRVARYPQTADESCAVTSFNNAQAIRSNATNHTLNIVNDWSVLLIAKPLRGDGGHQWLLVDTTATNSLNDIDIGMTATDDLLIRISDDNVVAAEKERRINNLTLDTWYHLVVTWTGGTSTILLYLDGVDVTAGATVLEDDAMNMAAQNRVITMFQINQSSRMKLHTAAIWNSVLGATEVTALYNGGTQVGQNLNAAIGNYTSQANLQWWFKPGADPTSIATIGQNYATVPPVATTAVAVGSQSFDRHRIYRDCPGSGIVF